MDGPLVTQDLVARALDRQSLRELDHDGLLYHRFRDDAAGVARGTVLIAGHAVPSYPSIGRIFVLERGLQRTFGDGPFWAEEKIDGYNVRVVRVEGRLLPLTRGGFVCPFTEDRLADMADLHPLFDVMPDAVLCCEVAGRDNPYIDACPPQAGDDVRLFAFDLMRLDAPGFVPLARRDALLDGLGVPRARVRGRYTIAHLDAIRRDVLALDHLRAEGLIFKPPGEGLRVKYVTPSIELVDIAEDAELLAELPGEFFSNRLLRLAISLAELGLTAGVAHAEAMVGKALVRDFLATVREVMDGGVVGKTYRVRVHSDGVADQVLAHLQRASSKIQVREVGRHREGDFVVLTLHKTWQHSTAKLKGLLDGQVVMD
ncbi:MAG: RNA ligase [Myxococcales bacterium]